MTVRYFHIYYDNIRAGEEKNEYLKSFRMTIDHYSSNMKLVYSEKFFDCKAVYVEEFAYDKFDTNQERLVKTIGVKCKRGH